MGVILNLLKYIMSVYNTIQEGINDTLSYLENRINSTLFNLISTYIEQVSDQVESTLNQIIENPELGPEYRRDIRNYLSELDKRIVSIDINDVSFNDLYTVRRAIYRYIGYKIPGLTRPDKIAFLIDRYNNYITDSNIEVKNRTEDVLMAVLNKRHIVDEVYDRLAVFINDIHNEIDILLLGSDSRSSIESFMDGYNQLLYDTIADRDPMSTEPRDGEILDDDLLILLIELRWINGRSPLDDTSLISHISVRDNARSLRESLLESGFHLSDIILNY